MKMKQNAFDIIVVGAGIGGLGVAIALAQKGFNVRILESKGGLNEFGASINVLPSAVRVLKAWGLAEAFEPLISRLLFTEIRNGSNNHLTGRFLNNVDKVAEITYGEEFWNLHRADYQAALAQASQAHGVKLTFDAHVTHVEIKKGIIRLQDGREYSANLIVGADGISSTVRDSIPALSCIKFNVIDEHSYRCTVPTSAIRNNPKLSWLLDSDNERVWTGPGKYVFAWPLPTIKAYDVVCSISRPSDIPAGKWGIVADPIELRNEFDGFCPEVRALLDHVDGSIRWTLAELPPLSTCRSENGCVVLMGDAWHAMLPHAASGGTSAIEDAAVLAECIEWAFQSGHGVSQGTEVYEELRKTRVERMQQAAREGYGFLNAEGELAEERDRMLAAETKSVEAELQLSEKEKRTKIVPEADIQAPFPSPPYMQWLYRADVLKDARSYLAGLSLSAE